MRDGNTLRKLTTLVRFMSLLRASVQRGRYITDSLAIALKTCTDSDSSLSVNFIIVPIWLTVKFNYFRIGSNLKF